VLGETLGVMQEIGRMTQQQGHHIEGVELDLDGSGILRCGHDIRRNA
jgi:hypothetical protein